MNSFTALSIAVLLASLIGCQKTEAPQPAPVAEKSVVSNAAMDKLDLAYTLLDGKYSEVTLDPDGTLKCVVQIRLGREVVYEDSFLVEHDASANLAEKANSRPKFMRADSFRVGLRPVDSGELEKSRRMRYAISFGGFSTSYLVRNPFAGMLGAGSLVRARVTELSGKPNSLIWFQSKGSKAAGAEDLAAVVEATVTKATPAEIASGAFGFARVQHKESAWAKAGAPKVTRPRGTRR